MLMPKTKKFNARQTEDAKQRFSIRKYSFGVTSVLLGLSFIFGPTSPVKADTTTDTQTATVTAIANKDTGQSKVTSTEAATSTAASTATSEGSATSTASTKTSAVASETSSQALAEKTSTDSIAASEASKTTGSSETNETTESIASTASSETSEGTSSINSTAIARVPNNGDAASTAGSTASSEANLTSDASTTDSTIEEKLEGAATTQAVDQPVSTATNSTAPKNDVNAKSVPMVLLKQLAIATNGVQPAKNLAVESTQSTNPLVASLETDKPATAWQPEPTTNYSADHTAKIDMTNQSTTVQGNNWQMSLDKNYIKAGQAATLTVNYEAQAGDTFILDIGYPARVNAQTLGSQIGTTSTKDNGLRTQVTNVFKQAGTYTQIIKLNDWKNSAEGLKSLRHVFGDQAFDLTLKHGTTVENAQDVGRLYLTSNFTPTMSGKGSVGVDRIDAKYVPVLSTNNNYIFSVRTNWSDYGSYGSYGTVLDPSYNGDFVYSVSVPKTFELDQAATEAFYQQIHNNEGFGNWGLRGSNVTVSQAGVGSPIVIKANALDWIIWHYFGNNGVSFLGHFIDAPSVATTVTSEGQTTVSDTIGGHTQTITLPGLSAKVINAADYNYADSEATVFSMSDYGDNNQLYQSHEVPRTDGETVNSFV